MTAGIMPCNGIVEERRRYNGSIPCRENKGLYDNEQSPSAQYGVPLSVSELREAADGQLSMFGVGRPSVMDQLAANRLADKKSPAQTVSRKNHEPEI